MAVMKLNEIDFVQTFQSDDLNVDVTLREMKLSLKNDGLANVYFSLFLL